MISKLKKKFIVLATTSTVLLMTVLVCIMNLINYSSVVSESDTILDVLSHMPQSVNRKFPNGSEVNKNPEPNIPIGMSPEVPYESRYFTVTVSDSGEIRESDLSKIISVDENTVTKYIAKAINNDRNRGFAENFRYLKTQINDDTQIMFLDCGRRVDSYYAFLWTSISVGFFGCVIVFTAFIFASGKIVKPIAESYEKQKRFISDAGHEIKTPLTIINANIDLIDSDEVYTEELTDIRQQTKRLTKLTNDLVFLSKMEENEHKLQKLLSPVSDIVSETVNSFNALATLHNLNIVSNVTPYLEAYISPDAIRQLISILMENAVKYSADNGTIAVELTAQRKSVKLSISNNTKTKIPNEALTRVFDRFYRTDSSRNSEIGGHGIGLSIAKAIVEDHGGEIRVGTNTYYDFYITVILPI